MLRRTFSFLSTISLVLFVVAVAVWVYSYKFIDHKNDRAAFSNPGVVTRYVGTSRGVIVYSSEHEDREGSKVGATGSSVIDANRIMDEGWHDIYQNGMRAETTKMGFTWRAGINPETGQRFWRFVAIPWWAVCIALLVLPVLVLMTGAGRKPAPVPQAEPTEPEAKD
jgi:hypothetical protein